jgi:hypothetical protein
MLHNELRYGGKSTAVGAPNNPNPYMSPQEIIDADNANDGFAQENSTSPEYIEFTPETVEPVIEESFAEVPTDTVSDTSSESAVDNGSFNPVEETEPFVPQQLATGEGFSEIPVDSFDTFDQMKSVVTGEQTSVEPVETPVAAANATATEQNSNATQGESFVSVADGFSGQLIIPLPGGGALRLDWPLGFDYVINNDAPQATFTEVPTAGDDFGDFTE